MFRTKYSYSNRETKAHYVWYKYNSILKHQILDVGADECFLKRHLREDVEYLGIDVAGNPDVLVNLEQASIPFREGSFECVLCFDVLEHLDNIHFVFDELCRVSRKFVIISLPNPWAMFYNVLRQSDYRKGQATKFYGLPLEAPKDRHKWFFSNEEAEKFIIHRAAMNNMEVIQMDTENGANEHLIKRFLLTWLFRNDLNMRNLYAGTLWAVLKKQ